MSSCRQDSCANATFQEDVNNITSNLVELKLSPPDEKQASNQKDELQKKQAPNKPLRKGRILTTQQRAQPPNRTSPTQLRLAIRTAKSSNKNLLVLDLNGTLLIRNKKSKAIYLRPHVPEFIDFILSKFSVLVWSSAMPVNVDRMVVHVFEQRHSQLFDIWNRTHLRLSREAYKKKVDVIKDLSWVWERYPQWNGTNTILIDDTPFKGQLQPFNHICLSEFLKDDTDDKELPNLKAYLEAMLDSGNSDVREYIEHHKYTPTKPVAIEK
ncbi:HAD-like protein [Basidiobolus meristosporus CBS 931.73]|uniref:Mitochondrial import inner membrane translocase subunit TIM50 n=1 Tax=Basidiobolus meristosporus CBS 931.73 TaxID=1314790 RepID=A0A1Y1YA58_9FUNG|nr:HAD-like protein [Basidiobolus meristosporus CBS 931.73]|eukprot:ORX94897.1 HAD-like protein [Basidiobolus meristosporus CBS 931.73]